MLGVKVCGLATALAPARDSYEGAAGSKDADQGPQPHDGTEEDPGADHGESQLGGRFINTSHTHSFR